MLEKPATEAQAGSAFSDGILHSYLLDLLFLARRLVPADTLGRTNSPAEGVTCAFVRLLEAHQPLLQEARAPFTHQVL